MKRAAAKRRVVIVDDDAMVRESVRLGLEAAGIAASAVEDASRALETIRAEKPDLVVLDLYMPAVDGREIARALKSDPATAKTPILFFSGSNEAIDVVSGLDAGGADYVTKPIDGEVLVRKIRSLLRLPAAEGGESPS
ncbi:MAG: response regulator [Elusimicrobia bacterium]|nr:response regulator [Elusimicrobiota bacterium]